MIEQLYQLILLSAIISVIVSLDVSVFTCLSLKRFHEKQEFSVPWAFRHAAWHAGFLAVGIGVFEAAAVALGALLPFTIPFLLDLKSLFVWMAPFIDLLILLIPSMPLYIFGLLGIVLFLALYIRKLKILANPHKTYDLPPKAYP